jgi:hypothetical protein
MHIALQDLAIILLAFCVTECNYTWANGVWQVLVWIDPSCPYAYLVLTVDWPCHSLLLDGLFKNAFTIFPPSCLDWLPWFGCLAWDLQLHICAKSPINKLSHTPGKMGSTYFSVHIFNHINQIIGEDWTDLLFLTPSVRYKHNSLESYVSACLVMI